MLEILNVQTAEDGTEKFLFRLEDGIGIETVLMSHPYGLSVCVSSQAGCNMGCAFCASGLQRKLRNLSAEEMEEQVRSVLSCRGIPISHAVVMGTGEPFDNFDQVIRFCDLISDQRSRKDAIPPRHITVSTCGIIPGILRFADTEKRYHLAVSLHAPNDRIRDLIMPVNRKYPIRDLLRAAENYSEKTRRRVTFEYLLLKDLNDKEEHAKELADLLHSYPNLQAYVNLIPVNPVPETGFCGSSKETALRFYDILMKNRIRSTLRKERGKDIAAACGQLRLSEAAGGPA